MDREILFRGKRADGNGCDGEWIFGYGTTGDRIIHLDVYAGFVGVKIDTSTAGQYTGLTDKNGVKIFEGDIMEFSAYGVDYKGAVNFIDGNFSVLCKQASPFLDDVIKRGGTVIGNIHDNPELMGGEEDG